MSSDSLELDGAADAAIAVLQAQIDARGHLKRRVDDVAPVEGQRGAFAGPRDGSETVLAWLEADEAGNLAHGELETRFEVDALPRLT